MGKDKDQPKAPKRDFRQTDAGLVKEKKFPAPVADELRVHIVPSAYDKMKRHAATTSEVELCGVLVGQVGRDAAGFFLSITGAIEGEGAKNLGSQVTFTHDTWTHIHEVKDRDFPDTRIVGWYHTHPGFGVFLSNMDTFIHENFFSEPYQVAIVLETVRRTEGCFAWIDGHCQALKRYWVGDKEVALAEGDVEAPDASAGGGGPEAAKAKADGAPAPGPDDRGGWLPSLVTVIFMVLGFAAGIFVGQMLVWNKVDAIAQQAAESEVYGLLERCSFSAMTSADLKTVEMKVKAARDAAAAEAPAATQARLAAIEQDIQTMMVTYDKRPSALRAQLDDLGHTRQNLVQRMEGMRQDQQILMLMAADLYLGRLEDLVGAPGKVDPSKFPPDRQATVKRLLESMIRLFPGMKAELQQLFPGLVEFYYGPAGGEAPKPAAAGT